VTDWLEPDDTRWRSTLRDVQHDFYHLPCYAALAARAEGGVPRAYYNEIGTGRILIPLLVRSLDGVPGAWPRAADAISPYGYPGPLVSDGMSDVDVEQAIRGFIDDGAKHGLITSFLRTHPLFSDQVPSAAARDSRAHVVAHGPTVSIDLTLEPAALDRQVRTDHRRSIGRLRAAGFHATFDEWDLYASFQAAYAGTMRRLDAAPQYRFDQVYFDRLRTCLDGSLHLCSVLSPAGELAAGGLFTHVGPIIEYHLSATAEPYIAMAPTKLMIVEARNWARQRGAATLHLGGGVGGQRDSLHMFKRGFGAGAHVFQTINIVHDPDAHAELTNRWLGARDRERLPGDPFFPIYRAG
jgi:hypothetical protein